MTLPPQPVPGWYPDPDKSGGLRWWDGQYWSEQRKPSLPAGGYPQVFHYRPPNGAVHIWQAWTRNTRVALIVGGGLALIVALIIAIGGFSNLVGTSESYRWGELAVDTAVSNVRSGLSFEKSCSSAIEGQAKYAGDPVLGWVPSPPKSFSRSDAQRGCLDQLHKQLGY